MQQPPDIRMPADWSAKIRKGLQRAKVVEKGLRELLGCFGVPLSRPVEYLFEIG
jgi:hypothetical protein